MKKKLLILALRITALAAFIVMFILAHDPSSFGRALCSFALMCLAATAVNKLEKPDGSTETDIDTQ